MEAGLTVQVEVPGLACGVPVILTQAGPKCQETSCGLRRQSAPLRCKVSGCTSDLASAPKTHQRFRLCNAHIKAPVIIVDGVASRFCQQCSRFHSLEEFHGTNRTCQMMLVKNRARQRIATVSFGSSSCTLPTARDCAFTGAGTPSSAAAGAVTLNPTALGIGSLGFALGRTPLGAAMGGLDRRRACVPLGGVTAAAAAAAHTPLYSSDLPLQRLERLYKTSATAAASAEAAAAAAAVMLRDGSTVLGPPLLPQSELSPPAATASTDHGALGPSQLMELALPPSSCAIPSASTGIRLSSVQQLTAGAFAPTAVIPGPAALRPLDAPSSPAVVAAAVAAAAYSLSPEQPYPDPESGSGAPWRLDTAAAAAAAAAASAGGASAGGTAAGAATAGIEVAAMPSTSIASALPLLGATPDGNDADEATAPPAGSAAHVLGRPSTSASVDGQESVEAPTAAAEGPRLGPVKAAANALAPSTSMPPTALGSGWDLTLEPDAAAAAAAAASDAAQAATDDSFRGGGYGNHPFARCSAPAILGGDARAAAAAAVDGRQLGEDNPKLLPSPPASTLPPPHCILVPRQQQLHQHQQQRYRHLQRQLLDHQHSQRQHHHHHHQQHQRVLADGHPQEPHPQQVVPRTAHSAGQQQQQQGLQRSTLGVGALLESSGSTLRRVHSAALLRLAAAPMQGAAVLHGEAGVAALAGGVGVGGGITAGPEITMMAQASEVPAGGGFHGGAWGCDGGSGPSRLGPGGGGGREDRVAVFSRVSAPPLEAACLGGGIDSGEDASCPRPELPRVSSAGSFKRRRSLASDLYGITYAGETVRQCSSPGGAVGRGLTPADRSGGLSSSGLAGDDGAMASGAAAGPTVGSTAMEMTPAAALPPPNRPLTPAGEAAYPLRNLVMTDAPSLVAGSGGDAADGRVEDSLAALAAQWRCEDGLEDELDPLDCSMDALMLALGVEDEAAAPVVPAGAVEHEAHGGVACGAEGAASWAAAPWFGSTGGQLGSAAGGPLALGCGRLSTAAAKATAGVASAGASDVVAAAAAAATAAAETALAAATASTQSLPAAVVNGVPQGSEFGSGIGGDIGGGDDDDGDADVSRRRAGMVATFTGSGVGRDSGHSAVLCRSAQSEPPWMVGFSSPDGDCQRVSKRAALQQQLQQRAPSVAVATTRLAPNVEVADPSPTLEPPLERRQQQQQQEQLEDRQQPLFSQHQHQQQQRQQQQQQPQRYERRSLPYPHPHRPGWHGHMPLSFARTSGSPLGPRPAIAGTMGPHADAPLTRGCANLMQEAQGRSGGGGGRGGDISRQGAVEASPGAAAAATAATAEEQDCRHRAFERTEAGKAPRAVVAPAATAMAAQSRKAVGEETEEQLQVLLADIFGDGGGGGDNGGGCGDGITTLTPLSGATTGSDATTGPDAGSPHATSPNQQPQPQQQQEQLSKGGTSASTSARSCYQAGGVETGADRDAAVDCVVESVAEPQPSRRLHDERSVLDLALRQQRRLWSELLFVQEQQQRLQRQQLDQAVQLAWLLQPQRASQWQHTEGGHHHAHQEMQQQQQQQRWEQRGRQGQRGDAMVGLGAGVKPEMVDTGTAGFAGDVGVINPNGAATHGSAGPFGRWSMPAFGGGRG